MRCGQRCSNPFFFFLFSLHLSALSLISLCTSLFTSSPPIKPPFFPPCPLTHFLLSKEEEPDYLTPPVWDSHLPIFLPVDHQPARGVMEGEIRRSTSHPTPQAASLLPPHLSNMHGAALCRLRGSECRSRLFPYCFLSSPSRRGTTQEQLFSRNASMSAEHVTVTALYIFLPFFHSLKISQSHYVSPTPLPPRPCSLPPSSLSFFLSSSLSTWNKQLFPPL